MPGVRPPPGARGEGRRNRAPAAAPPPQNGAELPTLERSAHREFTDAEIAEWDARVDAWAEQRGSRLAAEQATEIQPWGYAVEVDGALVWTDDPVLE